MTIKLSNPFHSTEESTTKNPNKNKKKEQMNKMLNQLLIRLCRMQVILIKEIWQEIYGIYYSLF